PLASEPRMACAEQHPCDVRHVRQISHRPFGRYFRYAVMREQCDQLLDHLHAHARIAMREIVDRGRDDRAHRAALERRSDARGGAHDDVARKLALLGRGYNDIAESADAGVHAVGTDALRDDRLQQAVRRLNAAARSGRQRRQVAFGDRADLPPGEGSIEADLGHASIAPYCRSRRARHCVRWLRSRSRATPTSRELRIAPGLLRMMLTQATPNSSSTSMARCSARVSTKWNCDASTNASTHFEIRL